MAGSSILQGVIGCAGMREAVEHMHEIGLRFLYNLYLTNPFLALAMTRKPEVN